MHFNVPGVSMLLTNRNIWITFVTFLNAHTSRNNRENSNLTLLGDKLEQGSYLAIKAEPKFKTIDLLTVTYKSQF